MMNWIGTSTIDGTPPQQGLDGAIAKRFSSTLLRGAKRPGATQNSRVTASIARYQNSHCAL